MPPCPPMTAHTKTCLTNRRPVRPRRHRNRLRIGSPYTRPSGGSPPATHEAAMATPSSTPTARHSQARSTFMHTRPALDTLALTLRTRLARTTARAPTPSPLDTLASALRAHTGAALSPSADSYRAAPPQWFTQRYDTQRRPCHLPHHSLSPPGPLGRDAPGAPDAPTGHTFCPAATRTPAHDRPQRHDQARLLQHRHLVAP